ncbi:hypothetical protein [Tenacibaculum sp.]|uniref:hypothetical protein n=1 Tax=Tenacibaculum sp. TaxID=1906242 RepID=UPI003AA84DD1
MKNFFLFLFFVSSINAQLKVFDSSAINLSDSFLELNQIITVTSFGGNLAEANKILNNLNKSSENYIIGKSILLYNLEGRKRSLEFIDSTNTNNEYKNYYKCFVSIITENIDDYTCYKNLIKDELLLLRLSIRRLIKGQVKHLKKEAIINQASEFLKSNKIENIDRLFIQLSIIEYSYWEDKSEKYETLYKLYEELPEDFNKEKLLEYIELCDDTNCEKIRNSLSNEISEIDKIETLLDDLNENSEENIKKIINNTGDKINLKSYVFLYNQSNKLPRDLKFLLGMNSTYSFSEGFVKFLKEDITREEIIKHIQKDKKFLKEIGFDKNMDRIIVAKDDEIMGALGIINHLKNFKENDEESFEGGSKFMSSASYNDFKSWDAYLVYLKNNPIHDERKIIDVKSKNEYDKILKELSSFNSNNPYQKKLFLSVLIGSEDFFQLDSYSAETILATLIELFALNQEEGNPESTNMNNNELKDYTFRNTKITDAMLKFEDKALVKLLLSHLSEEKKEHIIKNLVIKISENNNNINLRNLYLKILVNLQSYDLYVSSYLGDINSYGKLYFDSDVESNLDFVANKKKLTSLLRGSYNKSESKENLLWIIDLFKKVGLEDEVNSLNKFKTERRQNSRY